MKRFLTVFLSMFLFPVCGTINKTSNDQLRLIIDSKQVKVCQILLVTGDSEFTEMEELKNAVNYWNQALDKRFFMFADRVPWTIEKPTPFFTVNVGDQQTIRHTGAGAVAQIKLSPFGCVLRTTIDVNTNKYDGKMLESILRHELGHVLGLADNNTAVGWLMYYKLDPTVQHPLNASNEELATLRNIYRK